MAKLLALLNVFRKGSALSNAAAWKGGQIATDVAALIVAIGVLAKAFGFDLGITDAQALAVGGGVAAVAAIANSLLTVATTDKIGLPPMDEDRPTGRDERGGDGKPASGSSDIERFGG